MLQFETLVKTVLTNGMQVRLRSQKHQRTVSIGVFLDHGVKNESVSDNGCAHFIEHVLFNIQHLSDKPKKIIHNLLDQGATYEAFTSKEYTRFMITCLPEDVEEAVEALSLVLKTPHISSEVVEQERQIILHEYSMKFSSSAVLGEALEHALWGDHSFGLYILGKKSNIQNFKAEDLLENYQRHYSPHRSHLIALGPIEADAFMEQVAQHFGEWKSPHIFQPVVAIQLEPSIFALPTQNPRVDLLLGFPAYSFLSPLRHASDLVAEMLGGGMKSRMFQQLREEKKLCYASTSFAVSNALGGYLGMHINCERGQLNEAYGALKMLLEQLRDQGFTPEELERARRARRTSILGVLENTAKHAQALGRRAVLNSDLFVDTESILLSAVQLEDVQTVVRQVLDLQNAAFVGYGVDEDSLLALN